MKRAARLCWCFVAVVGYALSAHAETATSAPSAEASSSADSGSTPPSTGASPTEPQTAPAPTSPLADSLQGEAKSDYEAGRLLYDSGDYASALLKFQSAYQAAGDVRLLWNAAACERNLRHYVKASLLVQQFLASHSLLVTPEWASRAQAFLDAALPLTAALEVESNRPNAEVYLDDERLGTPALASQARVDLGTHRVVLRERGYQSFSETLTVMSSTKVHVTAQLRPIVVPLPAPLAPPTRETPAARYLGLPAWAWVAGGGVVLAGIATASYFMFKPSDAPGPVAGSIGSALRF